MSNITQIRTAIDESIFNNLERHTRTRIKEISKDKKKKGAAHLDYPIIQDSLCRFYIRYIPASKTAYIEYKGERLYITKGEPIEIYCDLWEFIEGNLNIVSAYTEKAYN